MTRQLQVKSYRRLTNRAATTFILVAIGSNARVDRRLHVRDARLSFLHPIATVRVITTSRVGRVDSVPTASALNAVPDVAG